MQRTIYNQPVHGVQLDEQTRCAHWHSELDIIAIRFWCCGEWYCCFDCHEALADHAPQVWPSAEQDQPAVLCGACGHQLSASDYLAGDSRCPGCGAAFNPGCKDHRHLYFGMSTLP